MNAIVPAAVANIAPISTTEITTRLHLPTLHRGQADAWHKLRPHRFKALRCGRRWGKTDYAKLWIGDGLARGMECGWFAPQHKTWSEAYTEMRNTFDPILDGGSKGAAVMRTKTGGRLDFWTTENQMAGRSRRYQRIVWDETAFSKDGDNTADGSAQDLWEKSVKPTLFDFRGEALFCSNSAGKNPDNFFYRICTDPQYGFHEYHARTIDNDRLPKRMPGESPMEWKINRAAYLAELKASNDPLVYAQEYDAEFVDWAGKAFFDPSKWFVDNIDGGECAVVTQCDTVFAVIDTAVKDGQQHDGTAVIYFALTNHAVYPLVILDWDILQIEGASLEVWLPTVFQNLEAMAIEFRARSGSVGAWIEDKASGSILLQQARNRGWNANVIESTLTAAGKDERAISISSYHYRGLVKTTAKAYNKTATFKRETRNHLLTQVTGFRVGDKDAYKRPDDLLDSYCYGVAIALGNPDGQ
jgi:hypothetical protein